MRVFALLVNALDSTNKTNQKIKAIRQFLDQAEELDKLWFLSLFTGRRPKRSVSSTLLRQWTQELTQIPTWLMEESYASVGDLGETLSMLLPNPSKYIDIPLYAWMERIIALQGLSEEEKKSFVVEAWDSLPHQERFIFNKLMGGSFRLGISSKSLINALALHYNLDANTVAHSIMGEWHINEVEFDKLIHGGYANTNLSKPYPFCLAYPIENVESTLIEISDWQVEYKWDGIRGQVIKRNGEVFIWSRGEELVTEQFPEIVAGIEKWTGDFVLDGEILGFANGNILNFTELQKRLNRKVLTKKILADYPVNMFIYDILELNGTDLRNTPLRHRRDILEDLYKEQIDTDIILPNTLAFNSLDDIATLRAHAKEKNSEGLMLKHKESIYHSGRKKGDWWKWKVDPYSIDAVLIYAQKGSGRRSGYYTDYTFAVKDGDRLVTVAKAYSGLTDKEIQEVSRFINKNSIEKFGPVRTVKPELVFELAFEGIGWSARHKSGVAVRFPRIVRWRKDKKVEEIDDISTLKEMIN